MMWSQVRGVAGGDHVDTPAGQEKSAKRSRACPLAAAFVVALLMTMLCANSQALGQASCEGSCGGSGSGCWCDFECAKFGDCCSDFCTECPDVAPMFCGGCCIGSSCDLRLQGQCTSANGIWQGGFTTCTPNPCAPPPPACGDAGTGDCCDPAGTASPFCESADCCEAVCACDSFCCDTIWDEFCAGSGHGGNGCGAQNFAAECACTPPPPPPDCGDPQTGDCCDEAGTGNPFCDDEACCACICACDPFCCDSEWDPLCAGLGSVGDCGASNPKGPCTDECSHCLPPPPPTLAVKPNPTVCYQVGQTVSVVVEMQHMVDVIVGGQFYLSYDASILSFVDAAPADPPSPFTIEMFKLHVPGLLIYATGVDAHGGGSPPFGTDGDAVMAKVTFTSLLDDVCAVSDLVTFERGTKLSDEFGEEVMSVEFADLPVITVDATAPVLNVPADVTQECDTMDRFGGSGFCASSGSCGVFDPAAPCQCDAACVTFGDCCAGVCSDCPAVSHCGGMASASDNCDPDPEVTFSDVIVPGACPQSFTVLREWTATDCSDNSASHIQAISVVDTTPPVVTPGSVPPNIVVYSDAGGCGAAVSWTPPTATDNCTAAGDITVTSTHEPGDFFGVGLHTVVYTFIDQCGNPEHVSFEVEVLGVSRFFVEVEQVGLEPDIMNPGTSPVERCIVFELGGGDSTAFEATLTFLGGSTGVVMIEVPCGEYDCAVARDPLHTLASGQSLSIVDADYHADFTAAGNGPGNGLVGGDLNDDNVVDILDFGVFVWQFAVNYGTGDTDCLTAYPHADISGDGTVNGDDFTFIQQNFLKSGVTACSSPLTAGRIRGLTRITVAELRRRRLDHLAIADLNGDGVVDEQDIVLWLAGVKP